MQRRPAGILVACALITGAGPPPSRPAIAHRLTIGALVLVALLAPLVAHAQSPGKVPRVGVVSGSSRTPGHPAEGFRQGLHELGYVEGQSILIEYRWAEGDFERFPELVADLIRLRVDVIVAAVTGAAIAARRLTSTPRCTGSASTSRPAA